MTPQTFQGVLEKRVWNRLATIDTYLLNHTFLVGERITLADISLATTLNNIFSSAFFGAEERSKIPNIVRLVET